MSSSSYLSPRGQRYFNRQRRELDNAYRTPPPTRGHYFRNLATTLYNSPAGRRALAAVTGAAAAGTIVTANSAYNYVTGRTMARTSSKRSGGNGGGGSGRRNPRFTKPTTKKKRGKSKKKLVIVSKKQVKKWNKTASKVNIGLSTFKKTFAHTNQHTVAANVSKFERCSIFNLTALKDTLSAVPLSNNVTVANYDVAAMTKSVKWYIKVSSSARWVNNFAVPVWVDVYCMVPKVDTSIEPVQYFTEGLVDIGGIAANSIYTYPSVSKNLTAVYGFHSHRKVCLAPGEEVMLYFQKRVTWDPSHSQSHVDEMQDKLGGHVYMVRLMGVTGHAINLPAGSGGANLPTTNVGLSTGSVDFRADTSVKVTYDSGNLSMKNYEHDVTALTAQTDGTIVGWASNAANTNYNVA